LREDELTLPAPEVARVLLSMSEQLAAMSTAANKIVRQPELRIRDKEQASNIAVVTELIRPASTLCLLEPEKVAVLVDRANAFALLSDNSFWLTFPLGKPREFLESAAEFPQIRGNTQMGLISYESPIPSVLVLANPGKTLTSSKPDDVPDEYTVKAFASDVARLRILLLSSLDELLNACREVTEQDKAALKALQPAAK
jgi:hypothetical protein